MGSLDIRKSGIKIQKVFQKDYYFFVSHSQVTNKRNLRVWGYKTNNLNRALSWFNSSKQWWNQNDGAKSLWIKIGSYPQLVAQGKGGSYTDRAFNSGNILNFMS